MRSNWPTSHGSAEHDDNLAVPAAAPLAWVQFNSCLSPVDIALDESGPERVAKGSGDRALCSGRRFDGLARHQFNLDENSPILPGGLPQYGPAGDRRPAAT